MRADPQGAPVDDKGSPRVIVLPGSHAVDAIPVWDTDETLLFGKPPGWKVERIPPVLCRDLGEALTRAGSILAPLTDGRMVCLGADAQPGKR
jgi:hypothetical protein